MGGHWRLGCNVCHWMFSNSREGFKDKAGRPVTKVRAYKWAYFNWSCLDMSLGRLYNRLRHHSGSDAHKIAAAAAHRASMALASGPLGETLFRPLAEDEPKRSSYHATVYAKSVAEATAQVLEDERVLRGRVPQCKDWLNAWAESTERGTMSAFGDILVRISSLPQEDVDRILEFTTNELHRGVNRPLPGKIFTGHGRQRWLAAGASSDVQASRHRARYLRANLQGTGLRAVNGDRRPRGRATAHGAKSWRSLARRGSRLSSS